jgi:hypothetical protein
MRYPCIHRHRWQCPVAGTTGGGEVPRGSGIGRTGDCWWRSWRCIGQPAVCTAARVCMRNCRPEGTAVETAGGGPTDATGGHRGALAVRLQADDPLGSPAAGGPTSLATAIPGELTEQDVGGGHRVHLDTRGLAVPGVAHRWVLADDRGLGPQRPADEAACHRRVGNGLGT